MHSLSSAPDSKEVSRRHGGGYWQETENARVATGEKREDCVLFTELIEFLPVSHLGPGLGRNRWLGGPPCLSSEKLGYVPSGTGGIVATAFPNLKFHLL